jgi:hypothetical protein
MFGQSRGEALFTIGQGRAVSLFSSEQITAAISGLMNGDDRFAIV